MQRKQVCQWTADPQICGRPQHTRDFMRVGCENVPLPPDAILSLLAILSDVSKVDCAGGKFILLPEYLTERDV